MSFVFENQEAMIALATEQGFTTAAPLNPSEITPRESVREMCASDKCHSYNKNWTCPPVCGTLEECTQRIRRYSKGLILQTTGKLEDSFDIEGMELLAKQHGKNMKAIITKLNEKALDFLPLGAGCCTHCETCAYPDAPCRFPKETIASMEAYGLLVSEVCKNNGVAYYYGPETLTYVGCVLFD